MLPPAATGSGASPTDRVSTGAEVTVVVTAAPATGVVSAQSTLAPASVMIVPLASGFATRTTSCAEPDPPAARAPTFQVTVPAECVPPAVADTKVVLDGTPTVTTVAEAFMLPLFDKVSV